MKKLVSVLMTMVFALSLAACSGKDADESAAPSTGVTIDVYNWGEYIDNEVVDVNEEFEKATGIKVNYTTFDNNEMMYTKVSSGAASYDVIFPSDYMVGKMIREGLLEKLNFDNIPNYQYIDEKYKNLPYDPTNEYSVPYMWGTVGIFYNSKYVEEADLAQGWDLLWDEKYSGKIFMFDNPRDAFGIALQKLGYSLNTENEAEWNAAYQELVRQKPLLNGYYNDQIYDKMINEEGWIAPYYAGDLQIMALAEDGNPAIKLYVPPTSTNFFVDAMCILKTSEHKKEAEAYINFLCSTDIAKANAEYVGYSTPQTEARKVLDPVIGENPLLYPSAEALKNTEMFLSLPDAINKLQDSLWLKLKK